MGDVLERPLLNQKKLVYKPTLIDVNDKKTVIKLRLNEGSEGQS